MCECLHARLCTACTWCLQGRRHQSPWSLSYRAVSFYVGTRIYLTPVVLAGLGIKPKLSYMLGKYSTTEQH